MPPFFSIILPTYNRAKILPRTIGSVLAQTFTDWELIIIDDGSTDNTKEIVASYTDERVKYIYQTNQERSAARNNGIANAQGEYICFLDSDDEFLSNHLEKLYQFILKRKSPTALIIVDQIVCKNGEQKVETKFSFNQQKYSHVANYFLENSVVPSRLCIHKDIIKSIKFDTKITICEDTDLLVRISFKYPVLHSEQTTFVYHLHDNNSVNLKYNAYETRRRGLVRLMKKDRENILLTSIKKSTLNNCYFGIFRYYVAKNKLLRARCVIFESIIKYPQLRLKEKIYLFIYPKSSLEGYDY